MVYPLARRGIGGFLYLAHIMGRVHPKSLHLMLQLHNRLAVRGVIS